MREHRVAILVFVLALSIVLDTILGIAFAYAQGILKWDGLYFATTTGTTVGYGDITPHGWLPHLIAVALMVIAIPLFGASFSLFTAGLAAAQVRLRLRDTERNIKAHLEERLEHHHRELLRHLTASRPEA